MIHLTESCPLATAWHQAGASSFRIGRHLGRHQGGAACCQVAMPGCRAAIDDDVRVACHDDRGSSMPLERACHLVADTCNALAFGVGGGGPADHGAAMTGGVANDDEWSSHGI